MKEPGVAIVMSVSGDVPSEVEQGLTAPRTEVAIFAGSVLRDQRVSGGQGPGSGRTELV